MTVTTSARFHSQRQWSLIPGPVKLTQPMRSDDLQEFESIPVIAVAESLLSFPSMRLLSPAQPTWWQWQARWESGSDFIDVAMTLFEEPVLTWGGSPLYADCAAESIEALWSHMQSRYRGVWLHDENCVIHTRNSFRGARGV
jgi:hypothetical protein